MKVLIVSTSDRAGGAAIAAYRLMEALKKQGVDAKMMVRDKQSDNESVVKVSVSRLAFIWERLRILLKSNFSTRNLWDVDLANVGGRITETQEFREANVIHLHWINQGFLSLKEIGRIMSSGKQVVWTLHDLWPVTGVCHYNRDCRDYHLGCMECPQMKGSRVWSYYVKKLDYFMSARKRLTFVGCSKWIAEMAAESMITIKHRVINIPNALPQEIFRPIPMKEARERHGLPMDVRLILFSAFKVSDKRKGIEYLIKALERVREFDKPVALVVVGRQAGKIKELLPPEDGNWRGVYAVPYVSNESEMAALYAAADVFVSPSLQDNLPNTIAEAMSVGTPCVGFKVGGIPEMIDHSVNGYVAKYCDAEDLAEGIRYCLTHKLRRAAAKKAAHTFNEKEVAEAYINKAYKE